MLEIYVYGLVVAFFVFLDGREMVEKKWLPEVLATLVISLFWPVVLPAQIIRNLSK